ncbi:cellulase family glycosylhydrolase [Micromonospora sp. WMMC241]|uniref:cellulase family glycosylhydrolase n=1 Tax=Micromonospora sp. WMMC241 TaxID=3015159 RepID=UPI0022B72BEE|nr:cellulase family glycosylhydrolase [Micromonospora sp. WMMC241]MCZ7437848.1 cellulase family glycosylhydrolase [Micromonospora sp. WMMC241]
MFSIPRPSRRHLLVGGAVGALALAATAVLPTTNAMAATGCAVTYTTNSWQGGFTANLTIKNLGDPVNNWTLGFTFPDGGQRLVQGWSATWQQSGSAVTGRSLDYNGSLGTGASTTVGFNGSWTGSNPNPTSFTLNGTVCTGGTTTPTTPGTPPTTTPPPTTPPPPTGTTPVAINGQLRVCGVNLCNQYGKPIQLRGMSTHGLQWFANCYTDTSLTALADDWQADLLRISMYVQEKGYETNPTAFTNQVNTLVDKAEARGMYALIDFHTLTPGDPMYNLDRAKTFFANVASRNAAKKNVIYEITNEPNGVSWSTIRSYAEQVIPVIRAADPDAVVIVGTRGWSSLGVSEGGNSDEIVNNPVRAENIMYTFHFYAASHKDNYRNEVQRAASRLPLFVTEFGTVTYTGDGAVDTASSNAWLDLLDRLKISYANWTFSDAAEGSAALRPGTCAAGTFTGPSVLTESGTYMRDRIRTPDNFPTS